MCYLVHLGIREEYASVVESPRKFHVSPERNPSISAAMGNAFVAFGLTDGGCSCRIYTSPETARRRQDDTERKREQYRRRGWSDAKIERALADAADAAERREHAPGLRDDVAHYVAELVEKVEDARLIVHQYHGLFSEERVPVSGAKMVTAEDLRRGIALDEDTLYTLTAHASAC